MDVQKALQLCGGAARRPALGRLGIDDASLRRAARGGQLLQPDRGLYALPTAPPELVRLLRNRELLTCTSAASHHGLWALPSSGVLHVHHRRAGAVTGSGVHHAGLLLPPQPDRPVAALADVLIHALRCLPLAESLVMVECAVQRGDITVDFLRARLPGRRNNESVVQGYTALRYHYADVVYSPADMVGQVLSVLARRR